MATNKVFPGSHIGLVTVVKRVGDTLSGVRLWECKCDCGNTVVLRYPALLYNKMPSCGCYSPKLTPGEVYGIYTLVDGIPIYKEGKSNPYYRLICECGNTRILTKAGFIYHKAKKCNCNTLLEKLYLGAKYGCYTIVNAPTVLPRSESVECECECGKRMQVKITDLFYRVATKCRCSIAEDPNYFKLYNIWFTIKAKCNNVKHPRYSIYGGKGISVAPEFDSFDDFYRIMAPTYKKGMRIKRRNNDLDFTPDNCYWGKHDKINLARSDYRHVIDPDTGKNTTVRRLAAKYNINPKVIMYRINMGIKGKELIAKT